jgi:DNA-binding MarR family transcriptional regulator
MSGELVLRELQKISKLLILANASAIEKELSSLASTDERKKMWILMDGKKMPKDIAEQVGVTPMAVSYFISSAVAAGLVEYSQGTPPRRVLDYVPPAWIEQYLAPDSTGDSRKRRGEQE